MTTDHEKAFPSLYRGLRQMGRDGCRRALASWLANPEKRLVDGDIYDGAHDKK